MFVLLYAVKDIGLFLSAASTARSSALANLMFADSPLGDVPHSVDAKHLRGGASRCNLFLFAL